MTVLAPGTLAGLKEAIKDAIGKPRFDLWFRGNTCLRLEDGTLQIGVPNRFYREWLESHFQKQIQRALEESVGSALPIRFQIDPSLFRRDQTDRPAKSPRKAAVPHARSAPSPARPSKYSMSRFMVGSSNQIAHAAAATLLENPRNGYSPLFLYGDTGLGKTHLLKAIDEGLRKKHPELNVLGFSCEEFTNEFLDAMRCGNLNGFRRKVRRVDVFVVDDVQFLNSKRATQEEFLHTLNALEIRGAKVILSCDAHPRRLKKLCEELRSRFLAGMTARLDPPDLEMRRRIIGDRSATRRLELEPEVVEFLAENLHSNVYELEGALNYLEHYRESMAAPLDLAATRTALAELLRHSTPTLSVVEVREKACRVFDLNPQSLRQKSRSRSVAHPRMLVLYLARKFTRATFSEIGAQIAGVNHSTVIAAEKKILKQINNDGEMIIGQRNWKVRDAVEAFERALGRRDAGPV